MNVEKWTEKVEYDKEFHKYHKENGRWDSWINSEEYAIAFKTYWKDGTVPHKIYPKKLIIHHTKSGTVSFIKLEGKYNWKETETSDKAYERFMSSRIYNKELAHWIAQRKEYERKKYSKQTHPSTHVKYHQPVDGGKVRRILSRILVFGTFAYFIMFAMNSWSVMQEIPNWISTVVAFVGTFGGILGIVSMDGILRKIFYIISTAIFGFLGLFGIGVIPPEFALGAMVGGTALTIFIIIAIVGLVFLFARYFFKWLGIGGGLGLGGAFGARTGWGLAGKLLGRK